MCLLGLTQNKLTAILLGGHSFPCEKNELILFQLKSCFPFCLVWQKHPCSHAISTLHTASYFVHVMVGSGKPSASHAKVTDWLRLAVAFIVLCLARTEGGTRREGIHIQVRKDRRCKNEPWKAHCKSLPYKHTHPTSNSNPHAITCRFQSTALMHELSKAISRRKEGQGVGRGTKYQHHRPNYL